MRKAIVVAGLAALFLVGCSMAKPVSIVVDDGSLEVQGVGRVSGKHVRYRSGLLEAGEAGVTFDGKASGFPASGPAPAPKDPPPPTE